MSFPRGNGRHNHGICIAFIVNPHRGETTATRDNRQWIPNKSLHHFLGKQRRNVTFGGAKLKTAGLDSGDSGKNRVTNNGAPKSPGNRKHTSDAHPCAEGGGAGEDGVTEEGVPEEVRWASWSFLHPGSASLRQYPLRERGAGETGHWRGRGAGCRRFLAWGGAVVVRACPVPPGLAPQRALFAGGGLEELSSLRATRKLFVQARKFCAQARKFLHGILRLRSFYVQAEKFCAQAREYFAQASKFCAQARKLSPRAPRPKTCAR
eukprot:gene24016-biopygen20868